MCTLCLVTECHYRPQRSCGQGYVFTRVCDSVNRGGLWRTPPQTKETNPHPPPGTKETPPDQGEPPPPGPRRTPPPDQGEPPRDQGDPPRTKENHPPPDQGEPPPRTKENPPPPPEEHCSIRSMSSRYASYWNAFLFN